MDLGFFELYGYLSLKSANKFPRERHLGIDTSKTSYSDFNLEVIVSTVTLWRNEQCERHPETNRKSIVDTPFCTR